MTRGLKIHLMFHTHDPRVLILEEMHRISTTSREKCNPSEHIFVIFPNFLLGSSSQTITHDNILLLAVVIQLDIMPHVKENLRRNFFCDTWHTERKLG